MNNQKEDWAERLNKQVEHYRHRDRCVNIIILLMFAVVASLIFFAI
jgi:hypothetical protein